MILHVTLNRPETTQRAQPRMVRDLTALADLIWQQRSRHPRHRDARRERHVLRRRRHQGLQGDVQVDAAAQRRREGRRRAAAIASFGSYHDALRGAAADDRDGGRGRGLRRRARPDVRRRRGAGDGGREVRPCRKPALGVPPAQIAPFVAARVGVARTRRLALTALSLRRPRGGAHRAGRHGLRRIRPRSRRRLRKCSPASRRCAPRRERRRSSGCCSRAARCRARNCSTQSADAFAACLRGPEGQEGVTAFLREAQAELDC